MVGAAGRTNAPISAPSDDAAIIPPLVPPTGGSGLGEANIVLFIGGGEPKTDEALKGVGG